MYLPSTYFIALLMLVVSMICWGSWANTFKLANGYRFELFYWDYILGMALAAAVYAFTLGSTGASGTPFVKGLIQAAPRNLALAFFSGIIFNVANLLLVAAIGIAGLAVAFPVAIGLALIMGAAGNYLIRPQGNPLLLFGGVALIAVAIILDALAYRALTSGASISKKGLLISLLSGILMGLFYPFFAQATSGPPDEALGPYAGSVVFVLGALICTFPVNGLYFMRKPLSGPPVMAGDYFRARAVWHLLGILGGLVWGTGTVFNFVASAAGMVGPAVSYALGQGATMVSAIWGVFVWHEFRGASPVAQRRLVLMFIFFVGGLALVAIAPLW